MSIFDRLGGISRGFDAPPEDKSKRLLLVAEDTPMILKAMLAEIEGMGVPKENTLVAENGSEAYALWKLHGADIRAVITDQSMPGMNGMELIKIIAEEAENPPYMLLHTTTFNGRITDESIALMGQALELGAQGVPKNQLGLFKDEVLENLGLNTQGHDPAYKSNIPA